MESLNRKAVILTVIILANVSFAGTYSGGFGTETEPYRIGNTADWQELMADSNDWDANFIMIADINLRGVSLTPVGGLSLGNNYMPLFKGIFDGNGHVVRNPSINLPGYWHIGLFGVIDSNSQIKNLGVEDANMSGKIDIAGLAGCSLGTITNCYATGRVMGQPFYGANCGGLVGLNRGTITGSYADCDVNGNCSGGLVGSNEGGNIIECYATGTVSGKYEYGPLDKVGGLVGWNGYYFNENTGIRYYGTISRCYATGSVNGGSYVGGLVGKNSEIGYGLCFITDCYAIGAVTGTRYVGGLIGANYGGARYHDSITNCYAAGTVTGHSDVGGLIGSPLVSVPYLLTNFWDINVTGQTKSTGGIGKTTAEMMTLSTFTSAGWDFAGETANGPNDVWFIREGKEYPRFVWENNKPVADAGPNQVAYAWIDGIAEVTLDANNSYDADGDELTYLWKWSDGNDCETNGVDLTIELPVGKYTFELVVNDGLVNSEPNQVVITVVKPIKSMMRVTPRIINNGCFGKQSIMAILQLPAGISKKQIDGSKKLLLYPGEIEANRQFVMSYYDCRRVERVIIWAYFDSNSLTDAVAKTGLVNLDVVGQLKTGQYFSGSDKVWVVKPPRKPVWKWPGYGWGSF